MGEKTTTQCSCRWKTLMTRTRRYKAKQIWTKDKVQLLLYSCFVALIYYEQEKRLLNALEASAGQGRHGTMNWEQVGKFMGKGFSAQQCQKHTSQQRRNDKHWTYDEVVLLYLIILTNI